MQGLLMYYSDHAVKFPVIARQPCFIFLGITPQLENQGSYDTYTFTQQFPKTKLQTT